MIKQQRKDKIKQYKLLLPGKNGKEIIIEADDWNLIGGNVDFVKVEIIQVDKKKPVRKETIVRSFNQGNWAKITRID